jgi:hydroxymethylbilane synthase
VPTRLRKLEEGAFDAIVLAAAGVARLRAEKLLPESGDIAVVRLDPHRFVPAPAQGALAVQCRRDDETVLAALRALDHAPSHAAVNAERDALARAEGGCDIAFGAHCFAKPGAPGVHELIAMIERNGKVHAARAEGSDPAALGAAAWSSLEAELARS